MRPSLILALRNKGPPFCDAYVCETPFGHRSGPRNDIFDDSQMTFQGPGEVAQNDSANDFSLTKRQSLSHFRVTFPSALKKSFVSHFSVTGEHFRIPGPVAPSANHKPMFRHLYLMRHTQNCAFSLRAIEMGGSGSSEKDSFCTRTDIQRCKFLFSPYRKWENCTQIAANFSAKTRKKYIFFCNFYPNFGGLPDPL